MTKKKVVDSQKLNSTDKNSDAAFAERMRFRLQDMLANPYSFLPSYQKRYETLMANAKSLTPHQAYAMTMLLGQDSARRYQPMPDTAELEFPRVNAVDLTAQSGWYYFTGMCLGEDGVEYGILCMLFQYALLPPPIAKQFGLTDVENLIVDLQLAVSVGGGAYYQVDPVVTAGTSGGIGVSDKLHLTADNCSVESSGKTPFPMRVQANGTDLGQKKPVDIAIDLTFTSGRGHLLQGMDGAEPLIAGIGTRYYSIPGIVLDAASSLKIDSKTIPLKSGTFWFDHQWGLGMSPSGTPGYESIRAMSNLNPSPQLGWDFFAMNFDGGYAMTLNSIHGKDCLDFIHQTGKKPPGTMTAPVIGKYMDPYGTTFNISGELTVSKWCKTNHSPNPKKYQSVDTWMPRGWEFTLQEKVVPERLRSFSMEPITDGPQALYFANGVQYGEAQVHLLDSNKKRIGAATAESVAYVDNLPTILRLAGLPATDENIALCTAEPPTPEMKFWSLVYFLNPANYAEFNQLVACGSFPLGARPTKCADSAKKPSDGKTPEPDEVAEMLKKLLDVKGLNGLNAL
jgi:predicted secreted hydrolase